MNNKKINYLVKNFADTRGELIDLVKQYYPSLLSDFNDASIASVFIDLNAAVTDLLSHHTDRTYQETQLEYATQRNSILNIARTLGLKISGKRPSITVCDFSVTVPTLGETFDLTYTPIIRRGSQVSGNGKVFELMEDVDFSSPFASGGIPNRLVIPNISANGNVLDYTIVKREIVQNGISKIYKRAITINEAKPFYTMVLTDENILNIESIIVKEGTSYTTNPPNNEFYSDGTDTITRLYEVDSLSEKHIFKERNDLMSDNSSIKVGKWVDIKDKFITEYTGNGYMKVTFGGGDIDVDSIFTTSVDNEPLNNAMLDKIGNIINNDSLGRKLKAGTTIFIKYRVGGGDESNIGSGVLNKVVFVDMYMDGTEQQKKDAVRTSLKINNPIPALGGRSEPSIEEIRQIIKYNFASQNRAVTLKDYHVLISKIDGKFGAPYRYGVMESQNKIVINVLSKDANNNLTDAVSDTLKDNIAEYLNDYRMINDYIQVKSGRVINIGIDLDIMLEKNVSKSSVISTIISKVSEYFNTDNFEMGDNIYLSNLIEIVNNINGVLNVIDIVVKNKVGDGYSNSVSAQSIYMDDEYIIDFDTTQTLFSEIDSMFEIKNIGKDIRVRVK